MDDDVAEVLQDPVGVVVALLLADRAAGLAERLLNAVRHRLDLRQVRAVRDDEIVGEDGDLADVDHLDVLRLLVLQRLDGDLRELCGTFSLFTHAYSSWLLL